MAAQLVGARLFAADIQRASIEGALVGSRLPYAGFLRYENACFFFLGEETDAQVYIDEVAVSGLTTSSTSRQLRVAVPDGVGGYGVYDAGFTAPPVPNGGVLSLSGSPFGRAPMEGIIGIAAARWRISTNAIGPPCDLTYVDVPPSDTGNSLEFNFGAVNNDPVDGQDGWVLAGTRWDDQSGEMHVVRFVRITPPGTFAATNGNTAITGTDTQWLRDLRPGDIIVADSNAALSFTIASVTSDTEATLATNWTGSTSGGHTFIIAKAVESWYDSEVDGGDLLQQDIIKPPPAAGVVKYGKRVLVWGCFGGDGNPTGPVIFPTLDDNPEHCFIRGIRTDSGGDLVNVLAADGPLYLMTTRGLELVLTTDDPDSPYDVQQIASPGFKASTNGYLFGDYFYGFNGQAFRTRASRNIDLVFAAPVKTDMEDWDPERVIITGDPKNQAVLYIYDDTTQTKVVSFMAQQEQWGPPIYFSGRFLDAAIVDGDLYVTVLDGSDITVHRWEGGAGIGGTRFIASEYYDPRSLRQNRMKILDVVGKCGSLSIYAATSGAAVPDVGDLGAATVTFTLSDTDIKEPEIKTHIRGDAFAFRVDFASDDGYVDKITAFGLPLGESR